MTAFQRSSSTAVLETHKALQTEISSNRMDAYFSADVETDGPIPGPFSMLSFAIVYAGSFDGSVFNRPSKYDCSQYHELQPISDEFQEEALKVNGLNRQRLIIEGRSPEEAMTEVALWVRSVAKHAKPVLVAYPMSFDWTWLYWYFVRFSKVGSPFDYSRCYDVKTAWSVKSKRPISDSGRHKMPLHLRSKRMHTHHALDDAIEQAEIFANIFEWEGEVGRGSQA